MVDFPIQQGNWFSVLREWRARRREERRRPAAAAPASVCPGPGAGASAVELSRLAMASPPDE